MLGAETIRSYDPKVPLAPMLKEVSVLSGGILVGLLVSQLDRIILSRTVDVASFGVYSVVATLALAFLQLQAPITRALFPLIVRDIQDHGRVSAARMKALFVGAILSTTLPALLACVLSPTILEFWLHDRNVVEMGATPLRLLLLAIALNSLYGCIYQIIIAKGQSHRVMQFNLISLVAATVTIYLWGIDGELVLGGVIWIVIALTQLLLGTIWIANIQQ
jgi:O-antigen/teichoic acid export membrane protein